MIKINVIFSDAYTLTTTNFATLMMEPMGSHTYSTDSAVVEAGAMHRQ